MIHIVFFLSGRLLLFSQNSGRFQFNKFRLKISEIPRADGPVHSDCINPTQANARLCKQDTKEQYWGQQFLSNGKGHFGQTRPTEITGPVKVDHLQSWSRIFWSDQTEMVPVPFDVPTEISGIRH